MRKVIISTNAKKELKSIFDYLDENWSVEVRKKFAQRFHKNVNFIKLNPSFFPKSSKHNDLLKCVVSKQVSILYSFDNTTIRILNVFDTRQNPKRLKNNKLKK